MSETEIIVVDDDQGVRRSLTLFLRGHGFRAKAYPSAAAVSADADAIGASLVFADYQMPTGDGFELLAGLRGRGWKGSAVLITGFGSDHLKARADRAGFDGVIEKPLRPNLLLAAARRALTRAHP